jgi:hypothetical protein
VTQQPTWPPLSQELALQCLDPWGRHLELVAALGYEPRDPYAVWITFPSPAGDVRWAMSRSVLLVGLTEPAGQGDLTVWPSIDEGGLAVVVLQFHSPEGSLTAQADTHEVHGFLSHTLAAVPAGTESDHLDLDALVDALLGRD